MLIRLLIVCILGACASGCIADYRIKSPDVSVVLAQGNGPELYRKIRIERRRPIVARHDWNLFTRNQVQKVLSAAGAQRGALLLVGEHLKNIGTMVIQSALAGPDGNVPWLAFKVRIYPDVTQ